MIKTPHEHRLLHPRTAYDLTQRGLLYLHEYHVYNGNIDFLTIDPLSGRMGVVECKMQLDWLSGGMDQVERYHRAFGIQSADKVLYSYHPVSNEFLLEAQNKGFQVFVTGEDALYAPVARRHETIDNFWDAFEDHYGMTLDNLRNRISPNFDKPSPLKHLVPSRSKVRIAPSPFPVSRSFSTPPTPKAQPVDDSAMRLSRFASRQQRTKEND